MHPKARCRGRARRSAWGTQGAGEPLPNAAAKLTHRHDRFPVKRGEMGYQIRDQATLVAGIFRWRRGIRREKAQDPRTAGRIQAMLQALPYLFRITGHAGAKQLLLVAENVEQAARGDARGPIQGFIPAPFPLLADAENVHSCGSRSNALWQADSAAGCCASRNCATQCF